MKVEIIGHKIVKIRDMTEVEKRHEGWDDTPYCPAVLVLDNGVMLYPSRDDEGNGPGALFGMNTDGEGFHVI